MKLSKRSQEYIPNPPCKCGAPTGTRVSGYKTEEERKNSVNAYCVECGQFPKNCPCKNCSFCYKNPGPPWVSKDLNTIMYICQPCVSKSTKKYFKIKEQHGK